MTSRPRAHTEPGQDTKECAGRYAHRKVSMDSTPFVELSEDIARHLTTFMKTTDIYNVFLCSKTEYKRDAWLDQLIRRFTFLIDRVFSMEKDATELVLSRTFRCKMPPYILVNNSQVWNQVVKQGFCLHGIRSIYFRCCPGKSLASGILPDSLIEVTFGAYYNQSIEYGALPGSLTRLEFGDYFTQSIAVGVLPSSLTQLIFGHKFNQPIAVGVLPSSLTQLIFGHKFNQPIAVGVLPVSLEQLKFGAEFDQPITEGVLPTGLRQLTFGDCFNQPLAEGVVPVSVTHMTLGRNFNKTVHQTRGRVLNVTHVGTRR
jgi:hypothetical protein